MKWKLPPEGWHKEKCDVVAKGNPGPSGCGGIIRNCYGEEISTLLYPLGHQTNHYAEASAALHMVKLAWAKGVKK